MSVARALLQSISQTISQFQLEGIPLVGLINRSRPWVHINAQAAFVTAFQDADDKQLDGEGLQNVPCRLLVMAGAALPGQWWQPPHVVGHPLHAPHTVRC